MSFLLLIFLSYVRADRFYSPAVFVTVCFVPVIAINVLGTRVYGETEFCESITVFHLRLAAHLVFTYRVLQVCELTFAVNAKWLTSLSSRSIKVITILGLILLGIIIDAGGGPNGECVSRSFVAGVSSLLR